MVGFKRALMAIGAAGTMALVSAPQLHAQAIIDNGVVSLGVDYAGNLNVNGCLADNDCHYGGTGVFSDLTQHEATFEGCPCEGWGAGFTTGSGNVWGGANASSYGFGAVSSSDGASVTSFTSTATTATSVVQIDGSMQVTQSYHPSATPGLFEDDVTITNLTNDVLGNGANGIQYRREMDWDIDPTPFSEIVTVHGNGATNLLGTGDNGFTDSDPFDGSSTTCNGILDADFYHSGPCDHGAMFDFGFPSLAAGASQTFAIFYGVAPTQTLALAALGAVGADDVYSFGQDNQCDNSGDFQDDGTPGCETFIFGFKGVGGTTLPDTSAPEPATFALFGTGLAGLGGFVRRRRAAK